MSEKLRESLSAIVDDEAGEFELRRVLDEVDKNPELRAIWERYHLFGSVLRSESSGIGGNLRDKVWAELEFDAQEQTHSAGRSPLQAVQSSAVSAPRWGKLTGLAVAATVAFAVVVGGLGGFELITDGAKKPEFASVGDNSAGLREGGRESLTATLTADVTPSDRDRINAYVLYHTQQRGMNQPGIDAFAKMVSYQQR